MQYRIQFIFTRFEPSYYIICSCLDLLRNHMGSRFLENCLGPRPRFIPMLHFNEVAVEQPAHTEHRNQ